MKQHILWSGLLLLLLSACVQERPSLELSIEPSALTIESGAPLSFTINGKTGPASTFITFYPGTPSSRYEDYPDALALSVGIPFDSAQTSFAYEYTYNYHGPVKATFIARDYGNWSEDQVEQIFEFDIDVVDNNTNITNATLKTPGLFGELFEGAIDPENGRINFEIPRGTNLSNLTIGFSLGSSRSVMRRDGADVATNDVINFSSKEVSFVVEAPSGQTQQWVFQVVEV